MNLSEQRIRELAHQIWESEGCPDGGAERHWAMARKLAAAELLAGRPAESAARARRPNTARATLTTAGEAAKKPAAARKPKIRDQPDVPSPDA